MLAKDKSSGEQGCDSAYLETEGGVAYIQATEAPPEVYAAAANLLPAERMVGLAPQVILDAADRIRAIM